MTTFQRLAILTALTAALGLPACGGGGAGDTAAQAATAVDPAAQPGATPDLRKTAVDPARLPIVYSWSPRSKGTAVVKGITVTALDNYDPLPDVSLIFYSFKEANVVDRAADGTEKTLYDCVNDDTVNCAALDPRVSPDNKKIAFSVAFSNGLVKDRWTINGDLPITALGGVSSAQIVIYHVDTGELVAWPKVAGVLDMHPEWISNDKLVFVSNRAKIYPIQMPYKSPSYYSMAALQRWTANVDGSNAVNIGPHDDMALHPLVLSDGNILTATWRVDEKLSFNVTPENQYWMTMTDQFGGNETTVLGAHETMFTEDKSHYDGLISLHFFGERSNGDLMTSNYYRANHQGLGLPIAFPRLPHGVEGAGSSFLPAIYRLLPWAQEEDNPTHRDAQGNFMGKGGYPSGLPGGEIMLTKGSGFCYMGLPLEQANEAYLKGPGCDTGIYVLRKVPSQHPNDLVKVVDSPDRHEFSADVRLPYADVYGIPAPAVQTRQNLGYCALQVVNARLGKLRMGGPECSKTGACIKSGYKVSDVARLAIYEAKPHKAPQTTVNNAPLEGHVMKLLGYAVPESDGSVNVKIPCDTPYKMRGVAADGTEFVRDQVKHSNRPGEGRTCLGCHAGHTESDHRADVPAMFAATLAGRKPAVDLLPN